MSNAWNTLSLIGATAIALTSSVHGELYQPLTFEGWQSAVDGQYTTIDFTGFALGTIITDQYSDLGVLFTDGNDAAFLGSFPLDGWGLRTFVPDDTITVQFAHPQRWIGVHHPGDVQMFFYLEGEFLFADEVTGGGGEGWFHGVITDQFFDKVEITDPLNPPFGIDNLYFGGAVPAPAGLALLALGMMARHRRRH